MSGMSAFSEPVMLQDADWGELQHRTGVDKRRIGHLLEELVEDGYAKGERLADTLGPREGLVEISTHGRPLVCPPVYVTEAQFRARGAALLAAVAG